MEGVIYIFIIGLTIAIYRAGLKTVSLNANFSLFLIGFFVLIESILLYVISNGFSFPEITRKDFLGIFLSSLGLVLSSFFIIKGLQSGLKVSIFSASYAIASIFFVVLIGYFIFGENISIKQIIGIILGLIAIFLLNT